MTSGLDLSLPYVVARAWESANNVYPFGNLQGPNKGEFFARAARKWSATKQVDEDLLGIDILVVDLEIQGVEEQTGVDGTKIYYPSGISLIGNGGGYRQLSETKLQEIQTFPVRVSAESLQFGRKNFGLKYYKVHDSDKLTKDLESAMQWLGFQKS